MAMGEKSKYSLAVGKAAEKLVQKKLWSFGFSAKDYSNYLPFDLLVDDKYKVEVKRIKLRRVSGRDTWQVQSIKKLYFDVLAVVLEVPFGQKIMFAKVTEKNKHYITRPAFVLTEKLLEEMGFTENPQEAFIGKTKELKMFDGMGRRKPMLKIGNWYSLEEVACVLDISVYDVKKLIEAKRLKGKFWSTGNGKRYQFQGEDIIQYLADKDLD